MLKVRLSLIQLSVFLTGALFGRLDGAIAAPSCGELFLATKPSLAESIETPLRTLHESLQGLALELRAGEDLSPLKKQATEAREISYLLQGAYRLLLAHPQSPELLKKKQLQLLKEGLKEMKWLEKTLGQYQVRQDVVRTAKKRGMPQDVIAFLKEQRDLQIRETIRQLEERDYLDTDGKATEKLLEEVRKIRKIEKRLPPDAVRESLQSEISRVKQKVEDEMRANILAPRYTYHELEYGAHALRRSLRWLKVYIHAYRDLFSLHPAEAKNAFDRELIAEYRGQTEIALGNSGLIQIKEVDYYFILHAISELKKVKGPGEMKELLIQGLSQFGKWDGQVISPQEAQSLVGVTMESKLQDAEWRTQEILRKYEDKNSLQNLILEARK